MLRSVVLGLLAACLLAKFSSGEDKLPPAVKPILEKAVRDVKKNREEFAKANEKPLSEARRALEELSTKLIKDGKTAEAGVVLKQVEVLEADVMRIANTPNPAAGRPAQVKPLLERLAGRWTHPNGKSMMALGADGKGRDFPKSGGAPTEGIMRVISDDEVEIRWSGGWTNRIRLIDSDTFALRAFNPEGQEHDVGSVWLRVK